MCLKSLRSGIVKLNEMIPIGGGKQDLTWPMKFTNSLWVNASGCAVLLLHAFYPNVKAEVKYCVFQKA